MGEDERGSKPHSLSLSVNQVQASALDCWICARAKRHRDNVKSSIGLLHLCGYLNLIFDIGFVRYLRSESKASDISIMNRSSYHLLLFPLNLNGCGSLSWSCQHYGLSISFQVLQVKNTSICWKRALDQIASSSWFAVRSRDRRFLPAPVSCGSWNALQTPTSCRNRPSQEALVRLDLYLSSGM